jgi:hypothetical protein
MGYQIEAKTIEILLTLADRDKDLYINVFEHYIKIGDPLCLSSNSLSLRLAGKLIEICKAERSYEILGWPENPKKRIWLFLYYMALPSEDVTKERLDQLYSLYQEAKATELPRDLDFLLKYQLLDEKVISGVTGMILNKLKDDPSCSYALSSLFNRYADVK